MAQFFTDFTGASVGSDPPTGWTARWDATEGWNTGAGPVAEYINTTGSVQFDALSWDTPGSISGDCQIVARVRTSDEGGLTAGVAIHASTAATSGYFVSLAFGTELSMGRMDAGAETNIGSASFTHSAATDYWIRLERTGNTIRCRAWLSGDSEPGTWAISTTDSNYTSGVIGLFARGTFPTRAWNAVGVGTAGDPAPTAPVSGGGGSLIGRDRRMGGGMGPLMSGGISG